MSAPFDAAALARALISARDKGRQLSVDHLERPPSLSSAMAVQAKVHAASTTTVAGWKVASGPGGQPVAAPLYPLIQERTQSLSWRPGIGLEVEFAIELRANLPFRPRKNYSREEIEAAVHGVYLGVEIIDSRLAEGSCAPFELFLADSLANGGYVLGPQIQRKFLRRGSSPTLTVSGGSEQVYIGRACYPSGDPIAPLIAYANAPSDQLGGLQAGQIITTGSLCGVLPLEAPARITITLNATIVMTLDITSYQDHEPEDKLV